MVTHEDIQETFTGLGSATNTAMDTRPTLMLSADTYTSPVAQLHQGLGFFSQICFFSSCLSDLQSSVSLPQPTCTSTAADKGAVLPCTSLPPCSKLLPTVLLSSPPLHSPLSCLTIKTPYPASLKSPPLPCASESDRSYNTGKSKKEENTKLTKLQNIVIKRTGEK